MSDLPLAELDVWFSLVAADFDRPRRLVCRPVCARWPRGIQGVVVLRDGEDAWSAKARAAALADLNRKLMEGESA